MVILPSLLINMKIYSNGTKYKYVVWELFSGNADITKRLNCLHNVLCLSFDWEKSYNPSYVVDLSKVTFNDLCKMTGTKPNLIWASPDCTTYSIASDGLHRTAGGFPVSELAYFNDYMNTNLWNNILIPALLAGCEYIVENPRGHYHQMPFNKAKFDLTFYFGSYGAMNSKPTMLFYSDWSFSGYICQKVTKNSIVRFDRISGFLNRCKMPRAFLDDLAKYVSDKRDEIKDF